MTRCRAGMHMSAEMVVPTDYTFFLRWHMCACVFSLNQRKQHGNHQTSKEDSQRWLLLYVLPLLHPLQLPSTIPHLRMQLGILMKGIPRKGSNRVEKHNWTWHLQGSNRVEDFLQLGNPVLLTRHPVYFSVGGQHSCLSLSWCLCLIDSPPHSLTSFLLVAESCLLWVI